jgi:hypothetical protein
MGGEIDRGGTWRSVSAAAALAIVLVQSTNASAQEPAPAEPEPPPAPATEPPPPTPPGSMSQPEGTNPNRTLGGHQFIFPQFVDPAFVATYFGLRIRLTSFSAPGLPTPLGLVDLDGVGLSESLDFGIKLFDFLGIYGAAGARSLISTNLRSLVYQGATYDLVGNIGAVVRLLRSESTGTQLSARAHFLQSSGQVSSLGPIFSAETVRVGLRDVLQGNLGESLRTPFHGISYGGMLTAAQAISPLFGLQATAGVGYTSTSIERWDINTSSRPTFTVRGVTYRLGLAASVDLFPKKIPIAIMAEYLLARQPTPAQFTGRDELDNVHTLFGGVYYSGRPNLQLGLGGGTELNFGPTTSPLGSSEEPTVIFGQFVMRYIW